MGARAAILEACNVGARESVLEARLSKGGSWPASEVEGGIEGEAGAELTGRSWSR